MSEERLQEIKDSVDFQREILLAQNLGTLCVDEEQELIDEIERLNKLKERYQLEKEVFKDRIDKAIEYMNYTFNISSVKEMYEIMNELEKILKGSDKE